MEGFATGFRNSTKPGFYLENEKYKIQFKGVMCDETKNIVSHGFEYCYNWREVMEFVLAATDTAGNDCTADIEEVAEDSMKKWITTFQGWGLLSSIVPAGALRHVVLSLAYTSQNWDEETGGDYSEEKVFDAVKLVYDNINGKEFKSLVPKLGIWFEEIVNGGEEDERKKNFTIFFNAKWVLEIKFVVEKKRVNRNLLELAAEAAVRGVYSEDEIENLEIPPTLFDVVRDKLRDAKWVRNYWRLKAEIEVDEEEIDIAGELVWPVNHNERNSDAINDHDKDEVEGGEEAIDVDEVSNVCDNIVNEELDEHILKDKVIINDLKLAKEDIAAHDTTKYDVEEGLFSVWLFLSLVIVVGGVLTCL